MGLDGQKLIVVSVSDLGQANFYARFVNAAIQMGYRMVYITYELSIYKAMREKCLNKADVYFVTRKYKRFERVHAYHSRTNLHEEIDVLSHNISYGNAVSVYTATVGLLESLDVLRIACIWCWGYRAVDYAMTDFASRHHIKTLFFELANIPGKEFIDPQGANCRSLLYADKSVLKTYNPDLTAYEKWRKQYISDKLTQKTVPQAARTPVYFSIWRHLDDKWGYLIHGGAFWRKNSIAAAYKRFFKMRYTFHKVDFTHLDYVFFPLQVSTDTQILINGNVSLMEAVEKVLVFAMEKGIYLVIKPHPAEKNPTYFNELKKKLNVYDKVIFTNENTFVLLQNARDVFTINSTVGLEAMILGKKPHVFGKALYENFTPDDIPRYIMGYLFDIDYWGTGDIPVEMFKKVLARAELGARTGE